MKPFIYLFILNVFIFISFEAKSASVPVFNFTTNSVQVCKTQYFYIELGMSNADTFTQGSFEITFSKTEFKGIDMNTGWPDDQVEIGADIADGMVTENKITNTAGKINIRVTHKGQSKDDIKIFRAKFECLTNNYGFYDIKLNKCHINSAKITALGSLQINITDKSLTNVTTASNTLEGPDKVSVVFPLSSLLVNSQVIIKKTAFDQPDYNRNLILKDIKWDTDINIKPTTLLYEISPTQKLQRPFEAVIPYAAADIPAGFADSDLTIYQWVPRVNGDFFRNAWVKIGGVPNKTAKTIKFKADTFTVYLVMADKYNNNPFKLSKMLSSPNPFSPSKTPNGKNDYTTLSYYTSNQISRTLIQIFDVNGKTINIIADESDKNGIYSNAGEHRAEWDGKDFEGNIAKTGIYVWHVKVIDIYGNIAEKAETVVVSKNLRE